MTDASTSDKKVFISYCHDDNDEVLGGQWVNQFQELLDTRLRQILGRGNEPHIWWDGALQGNQDFSDELIGKLRDAAILISVLTPSYIESAWCLKEIEEFVRAAEQDGGIEIGENQRRIFKVEKTPVDRAKHPSALQGQIGYQFYINDKEKGRPSELSLSPDDPKKTAIAKEVIEDLAYSIINTLKAMTTMLESSMSEQSEQSGTNDPQPAPEDAAAGKTVYLAETSYDIHNDRLKVCRELEGLGFRVLPHGSLPLSSPDEFEAAVREGLDKSSLSVHMIGGEVAHRPARHEDDVVMLQNRIAAERSESTNLLRLIWLPKQLASEDERHQSFIESLQRDPASHGNADVLQVPRNELTTTIQDVVTKLGKVKQKEAEKSQDTGQAALATEPKKIYVCFSRPDKDAAEAILNHLFDNGFDVLEPLLDETAEDQQVLEIHKANLAVCDATLLFVDKGGEYWLKAQISELLKAPHYRDGRPLLASAVYLGSNMSGATVRTRGMLLKAPGEFSPDILAPFVEKLAESVDVQS